MNGKCSLFGRVGNDRTAGCCRLGKDSRKQSGGCSCRQQKQSCSAVEMFFFYEKNSLLFENNRKNRRNKSRAVTGRYQFNAHQLLETAGFCGGGGT